MKNWQHISLFCISILFALCLFKWKECNKYQDSVPENMNGNYIDTIIKDTCIDCNKYILYNLLCDSNVLFPNIVCAQGCLETGYFTSNYYNSKHNLFGFSNGKNYIYFDNIYSCIHKYKKWQYKYYKGGDYYDFLSEYSYAKDTNYVEILKQIHI